MTLGEMAFVVSAFSSEVWFSQSHYVYINTNYFKVIYMYTYYVRLLNFEFSLLFDDFLVISNINESIC